MHHHFFTVLNHFFIQMMNSTTFFAVIFLFTCKSDRFRTFSSFDGRCELRLILKEVKYNKSWRVTFQAAKRFPAKRWFYVALIPTRLWLIILSFFQWFKLTDWILNRHEGVWNVIFILFFCLRKFVKWRVLI